MQENHRSRVAAERRKKTRQRLLESALVVFAEKGVEAAIIDDVITLAGVSRGSFYNYFKTNDELLEAVAVAITNDMIRIVDPVVQKHADPVIRLALGLRLLLHAVRQCPTLAAFIARLRWPSSKNQHEGIPYLSRDILEGMRRGGLPIRSYRLALDVFLGTFFCAANTITQDDVPESYPEDITRCILLGLGVDVAKSSKAIEFSMPELSFDGTSILRKLIERRDDNKL
jgi:AcrR family transcriptional regulator